MFELKKLPFEMDEMNPLFTKEQLEVHYTKHHQAYCDNFNKAVSELELENVSALEIISKAGEYNQGIINHGGGYFNHEFFWDSLSSEKKEISEKLMEKISEDFGSLENLKEEFLNSAKTVFGSGWAWLILNEETNKLEIVQTSNQDSPVMDFVIEKIGKNTPLLTVDVWEHAYYVDYKNLRPNYLNEFWEKINWKKVSERFEK